MKHVSRLMFSSTEQLADWQYVSKIHNSLKHSNINEAMRYLINVFVTYIEEPFRQHHSRQANLLQCLPQNE